MTIPPAPQPEPENPSLEKSEAENLESVEPIAAPSLQSEPEQIISEEDAALQAREEETGSGVVLSGGGVMTSEEFREFTGSLFEATGTAVGVIYPPTWRSITDAPTAPDFPRASDALHRLSRKYPWLHFLTDKDQQWLGDVILVGLFGNQIYQGVTREATERALAARAAKEAKAAAAI